GGDAGGGTVHVFVLHPVARLGAAEAPAGPATCQPRPVEQLTELVGRMPLKDIVRESTDLIERLCIEAALVHTGDNRASAAELLGLSRQSLYSKMHRHGLGNLAGSEGE
ncbi:MAG: helix-turn-helix domain-containing protein, partial [Sphingomonadaceae bacterium]